jgi:hypothetical protein
MINLMQMYLPPRSEWGSLWPAHEEYYPSFYFYVTTVDPDLIRFPLFVNKINLLSTTLLLKSLDPNGSGSCSMTPSLGGRKKGERKGGGIDMGKFKLK